MLCHTLEVTSRLPIKMMPLQNGGFSWLSYLFTHWSRDKIATTMQTKFSNAFLRMKMPFLSFKLHWTSFLKLKGPFHNKPALANRLNRQWAIIWNDYGVVYLCMYTLPILGELTYLALDEMDAHSQTIFSDAFWWMKSFIFWLKLHWSLFVRVQMTITRHWFR